MPKAAIQKRGNAFLKKKEIERKRRIDEMKKGED
jgi:hypothetical protein